MQRLSKSSSRLPNGWSKILLLLAYLFVGCIALTQAATTTSNYTVTANVSNLCQITSLASPTAPTISAAATPAQLTANFYITCTTGDAYQIEFSPGANGTDGNPPTRYVVSGANRLQYQIYDDAGETTVWGDAIGTNTYAATGNGASQGYTYHVQLSKPAWTLPAGSYSDTVNVTVSY